MEIDLTRRRVVITLGILGAGTGLTLVLKGPLSCVLSRNHEFEIIEILGDNEAALEVGGSYLARFPQEADSQILSRLILGNSSSVQSSLFPAWNLQARMFRRIAADYETGATFPVLQWIFSLTEIRICALYVLLKAPRRESALPNKPAE
jgi:hypothetical protein